MSEEALWAPRDPNFSAQERALFETYRDLAKTHITPRVKAHDACGAFDRASFVLLGKHGFHSLGTGSEGSLFAAIEGLCTGCDDAGFAISVIAHTAVAIPVVHRSGTKTLQDRWLGALCSGEALAAVANAEPQGGTDVLGVRARVRRRSAEGERCFSGRKYSVTNVSEASLLLVSARDEQAEDPKRSLVALALGAQANGCFQRVRSNRLGLRTSPTGDLLARNVSVQNDDALGDGIAFFRLCFALERLAVGSLLVASLRRTVRRGVRFLREKPELAKHQYVQDKVVQARMSLALCESLLFSARARYLRGLSCEAELSTLKSETAERALASAEALLKLQGARGYSDAGGAEKDVRDLLGLTLLGGTAELHRMVVFRAAMQDC